MAQSQKQGLSWNSRSNIQPSMLSELSMFPSDIITDKNRAGGSSSDLIMYQDSSGFIHMDDEKEYRWGEDGSSLHGHRNSNSKSSGGHSSHSRHHDHSDHIFYADMDLVTDSQTRLKLTRQEKKAGFDLERWWLMSNLSQRLLPFLVLIFLLVALIHLGFGLFCFAQSSTEWDGVVNPYVCNTTDCRTLSDNLAACINPKGDPCVDFYDYACGAWFSPEESPEGVPTLVKLTDAYLSYSEGSTLGRILKLQGDTTDRFIDLYKACIDIRSRERAGIDPILRIIRSMLPSLFEHFATYDVIDHLREGAKWASFFGETGFLRYHPLPGHKVSLTRPDWVRDFGETYTELLMSKKVEFEETVKSFYEKVWAQMITLGLIKVAPYTAAEAAELVIIMMENILNVYDPEKPVLLPTDEEAEVGRKRLIILLQGSLDDKIDPTVKPSFSIVDSTVAEEKHAFGIGNWDAAIPKGSFFPLLAPGAQMAKDLTVNRRKPLPDKEKLHELYKAIHAFRIFLLFFRYAGVIPSQQWTDYGLNKMIPGHLKQDDQRVLKIESYCLSNTVFYLNSFTQLRLLKISEEERLNKQRDGMEELQAKTKQSLRRWYFTKLRAGELDPRLDKITREFITIHHRVEVEFPLPKDTPVRTEILKRQAAYLDEWVIDPSNYLKSLHDMTGLLTRGRLRDWRNNKLRSGENHRLYLDVTRTRSTTPEGLEYASAISFPLLLLEPPYFLNPMKVMDYAGTALFMARTILQLWKEKTRDPGGLNICPGLLSGLGTVYAGLEHHADEGCRGVTPEDTDITADRHLSFPEFLKNSQGLGTLAFKVAYDLFEKTKDFATYVDLETGDPLRRRVTPSGAVELIAPFFYRNGSSAQFFYTKYPNKTWSMEPVDKRRFVLLSEYRPYRLEYKHLVGMENYTLHQLFFLQSINALCFSNHGRTTERFRRYKRLMNGVFQQLGEFAEAWGCSLGDPMQPTQSCFATKTSQPETAGAEVNQELTNPLTGKLIHRKGLIPVDC